MFRQAERDVGIYLYMLYTYIYFMGVYIYRDTRIQGHGGGADVWRASETSSQEGTLLASSEPNLQVKGGRAKVREGRRGEGEGGGPNILE